jgi:hypothetical protein
VPSKIILYVINLAFRHSDVCGSEVVSPSSLNFAPDEREWSGSRPGRLTPGEYALFVDLIGELMDPGAGLDTLEKRKSSCPTGNPPTIRRSSSSYSNRSRMLKINMLVIIIIYFNCKWVFTRWQWYYNKTQHTNNTHHTK